jgi:hypothetical protein
MLNRNLMLLSAALGFLCAPAPARAQEPPPPAKNLILISIDGMRWQEVFGGVDPLLVNDLAGGVVDPARVRTEFARESAEESRTAIMPFFWEVVAKKGVVFGDRGTKNVAKVANPFRTSYPGYNEMLAGFVDPAIVNNTPRPNQNVTVLEWLNGRPGFVGKVAAFAAWNRLPAILNVERSKLPAVCGWEPIIPFHGAALSEKEKALNEVLARSTRIWPDECPDGVTMAAAMEYFTKHKPRVYWISLGEVDEWGHGRRYDLYLESARRSDAFVREIWERAQSMPEYAEKTVLVLVTDHGRGAAPATWTGHGPRAESSEGVWMAFMGPGVKAGGVAGEGQVGLGQLASTMAALVGENYETVEPRAAKHIEVDK